MRSELAGSARIIASSESGSSSRSSRSARRTRDRVRRTLVARARPRRQLFDRIELAAREAGERQVAEMNDRRIAGLEIAPEAECRNVADAESPSRIPRARSSLAAVISGSEGSSRRPTVVRVRRSVSSRTNSRHVRDASTQPPITTSGLMLQPQLCIFVCSGAALSHTRALVPSRTPKNQLRARQIRGCAAAVRESRFQRRLRVDPKIPSCSIDCGRAVPRNRAVDRP